MGNIFSEFLHVFTFNYSFSCGNRMLGNHSFFFSYNLKALLHCCLAHSVDDANSVVHLILIPLGSRVVMNPVHQLFRVLFPSQHLVKLLLGSLELARDHVTNSGQWVVSKGIYVTSRPEDLFWEPPEVSLFPQPWRRTMFFYATKSLAQGENSYDSGTQPFHMYCIFWRYSTSPQFPKHSLPSFGHKLHASFRI